MRRSHMLVVTAIVLAALSACGSSEKADNGNQEAGSEAKVATLTSAAATPSASSAAQRPRERLDTTPEEFEALLAPYNKCMREHGGVVADDTGAGTKIRTARKAETKKFDDANRICEPQFLPLPPWEKDPANPESRDFARDVVKCLKEKGIKYVEVADDGISVALGGEHNDSRSIRRGMDLAPECERQVAAARK